jgi:hypothetical protein
MAHDDEPAVLETLFDAGPSPLAAIQPIARDMLSGTAPAQGPATLLEAGPPPLSAKQPIPTEPLSNADAQSCVLLLAAPVPLTARQPMLTVPLLPSVPAHASPVSENPEGSTLEALPVPLTETQLSVPLQFVPLALPVPLTASVDPQASPVGETATAWGLLHGVGSAKACLAASAAELVAASKITTDASARICRGRRGRVEAIASCLLSW